MKKMILAAFMMCLASACSEESVSVETLRGLVSTLSVTDIGNAGNASDVRVRFTASSLNDVNEFRIVMVPSSSVGQFNEESARALESQSYQVVEASKLENEIQLNGSLLDTDGNSISKDATYRVQILVSGDGALAIAGLSTEIVLEDVHVLQGRYRGIWNDNFYSNFGVTADLEYNDGVLRGPFYYTSTFAACCGGNDDGEIILHLEGDKITSFIYNQRLITYMNGCNGTYNGDGEVQSPTELLILFEGDDCDGHHTGGRISLSKL